jgi:hypothetical protein
MGLTGVSWFGLGIRYGWGYCPCTDWHWQVRERLGYIDPPSYTQMLITVLTGRDIGTTAANVITVVVFAASLVLSVVLRLRDRGEREHRSGSAPASPRRR